MTADVVGKRIRRGDAVEKVTGQAVYAGDIRLPRMVHGALVGSPVPKGRIKAIDASEALQLPGVELVITAADLRNAPINCSDIRYGVMIRDRPILAEGNVSFRGEPVAAVVAADRRTAQEAAQRVIVDIEEEPAATDLDSALDPRSPLVHPDGFDPEDAVYRSPVPIAFGTSNIALTYELEDGDVRSAFSTCASVHEASYRFPAIAQYAMEPHCVLAQGSTQGLTVWSSAQHPSQVRRDLARLFGVPLAQVRVIAPYVGGGFGSKSFTHIEPIAVALSKAVGKPVRLELDVSEAMLISRRHNALANVRCALDEKGAITGFDLTLAFDTGAYTLIGPSVAERGAYRGLGGYKFPSFRVRSSLVFTNTSPAGSMRSIGGPQAAFALESVLDEIARDQGVSPLDMRRKYVTGYQTRFREGRSPIDSDLQACLGVLDSASKELADILDNTDQRSRGHGFALGVTDPGASAVSTAIVRLDADGSLTISVGSSELGQGVLTVMRQIGAQVLSVDIRHVRVHSGDAGHGPYDASTGASRSTTMSGLAVQRAAQSIRDRLRRQAARTWSCREDDVELVDSHVVSNSGFDKISYGEIVKGFFGHNGGNFIGVGEVTEHEFPTSPPFWEVAAGYAAVLVDQDTGVIEIDGYAAVADVGLAVNPLMLEGQEEGAFAQGVGHTLYEALDWEAGYLTTDSLLDYRVPRIGDVPRHWIGRFIESRDGPGPFGLKGGGEGTIVPVAAAVANALFDAVGVRIRELPLSPERVWRALQQQDSET